MGSDDSKKNIRFLFRYADSVFDTTRVRTQDVRSVIAGIADNPAGSQVAWRFTQMYWDKLLEQFGAGSFTMGAIIESVIGHFSNEFDYASVKDFFTGKKVGSGKRALEQSMEQILINLHWRQNSEEQIRNWIKEKFGRRTNNMVIE